MTAVWHRLSFVFFYDVFRNRNPIFKYPSIIYTQFMDTQIVAMPFVFSFRTLRSVVCDFENSFDVEQTYFFLMDKAYILLQYEKNVGKKQTFM